MQGLPVIDVDALPAVNSSDSDSNKKQKTSSSDVVEVIDVDASSPLPARPPALPECRFGKQCRLQDSVPHCAQYAHNNPFRMAAPPFSASVASATMLSRLQSPVNLFGPPSTGLHQQYLADLRRAKEREEEELRRAIAASHVESQKARERETLRNEQEKEYKRGLRRDKRKEKKAQKRQREEEEQRAKEEQEAREKAEQQQKAADARKALFSVEEPSDANGNVVSVTFQFPDGLRLTRRFLCDASQKSDVLYEYVLYCKEQKLNEQVPDDFVMVQLPKGELRRGEEMAAALEGSKRVLLFVKKAE